MTKRKRRARTTPRRFTEAYKLEAIRQLSERRAAGESVERIAADLELEPSLLRQWIRDRGLTVGVLDVAALDAPAAGPAGPEAPPAELRRLRRENAQLRQERDF